VAVGAGYFSPFHLEAWNRIPDVEIIALCDLDVEKARTAARRFDIDRTCMDLAKILDSERPDFVDIITPPASHLSLCRIAAEHGIDIICQKPLAPDIDQAREIVALTRRADVRFMVHENFRFQPWHQEIKKLLERGAIGERVHSLYFRCRQGDGWGEDAYLERQPYFRTMPRMLLHETGIHYIDTFRFLAGDVESVYAILRRLNPVIKGEDCALMVFQFASGAVGVWDANRYNESCDPDPRYTFGDFTVEGNRGTIRLYPDGRLTVQRLGEPETGHTYSHERRNFSGDCVYFTQRHFVDAVLGGRPFATTGEDYLKNLEIEEAFYTSSDEGRPVPVEPKLSIG
jgi:predicted dehydrogenase